MKQSLFNGKTILILLAITMAAWCIKALAVSFLRFPPEFEIPNEVLSMLCTEELPEGITVDRQLTANLGTESDISYGAHFSDVYTIENSSTQAADLTLYYPRFDPVYRSQPTGFLLDDTAVNAQIVYSKSVVVRDKNTWMDLLSALEAPSLAQTLSESGVSLSPSDGGNLEIYRLDISIPAGETMSLSVQWAGIERTSEMEGSSISITTNYARQLPCKTQDFAMINYGEITILDQTLALDLENGINRVPLSETHQHAYFDY